jgi:hypothetical protein
MNRFVLAVAFGGNVNSRTCGLSPRAEADTVRPDTGSIRGGGRLPPSQFIELLLGVPAPRCVDAPRALSGIGAC